MPSAFLQWLYADAADVPQTEYEVSPNSDPLSPKFTRPRNSASGSIENAFSLPPADAANKALFDAKMASSHIYFERMQESMLFIIASTCGIKFAGR